MITLHDVRLYTWIVELSQCVQLMLQPLFNVFAYLSILTTHTKHRLGPTSKYMGEAGLHVHNSLRHTIP